MAGAMPWALYEIFISHYKPVGFSCCLFSTGINSSKTEELNSSSGPSDHVVYVQEVKAEAQ